MIKLSFIVMFISLVLMASPSYALFGDQGACKTQEYKPIPVSWQNLLGKWYSIQVSASFYLNDPTDKCSGIEFYPNGEGSKDIVHSTIKENGEVQKLFGVIKIESSGFYQAEFFHHTKYQESYEVVYATEDHSVLALASCEGFKDFGTSNIWIISRDYEVDRSKIEIAVSFLTQHSFGTGDLVVKNTIDCHLL